jgi:tetratricopeptide (TPR) repeat protein
VLLALWGLRMILEREFRWHHCPVALCLGGLFFLGIVQTIPLPHGVLAVLSPTTAQLYERLLPLQQESVRGMPAAASASPPGATLSLYPAATRRATLRVLAVLLVFACVRNNLASSACLRRLSIVALSNGALLSLFGVVQQLSSGPHLLYWSLKSYGLVFGPFICRNHFPFYVNMSLGLGLGLLLSLQVSARPVARGRSARPWEGLRDMVRDLLQHPLAPWVALGLGLCLTGTLFSLSRGGFLAFLGAAILCLVLKSCRSGSSTLLNTQTGAVLLGLALAFAVAIWFGYDRIVNRLSTILGNEVLDSRYHIWGRSLNSVPDFPLLGSGLGTFQYVEALHRTDGSEANLVYENAHNDYIEALIEGGVVELALCLTAIFLLARFGLRALLRYERTPREGLVWGALFATATVAIHSFGDFGLHIPAIALLITVLSAQLCGLGDGTRPTNGLATSEGATDPERAPLRGRGIAPYAAAAVLVALGLVLCGSGWATYVTYRLREAAADLSERTDLGSLVLRAAYLDVATRLNPDFAHLEVRCAQAHTRLYDEMVKDVRRTDLLLGVGQLVLDSASSPGAGTVSPLLLGGAARQRFIEAGRVVAERLHLVPALQSYLRARNACPLMEEPHRALAQHIEVLDHADTRAAYLERAKFLASGIPLVWFQCGRLEVDTDPQQALASWRHSLELAPQFLEPILDECKDRFTSQQILDGLLPDNATVLLHAACYLFRDDADVEERKPFLERSLHALAQQPGALNDEDIRTKALSYRYLGRTQDAVAAYGVLLSRQPRDVRLRLSFAWYLYQQQRYEEARRELLVILTQQPRHTEAQALLKGAEGAILREAK